MNSIRSLAPFVFLGLAVSPALLPAEDAKPPSAGTELLRQLDNAYVQLFDKVAPAVVIIEANKNKSGDEEQDIKGFDFFFHDPDDKDDAKHRFRMPQPSVTSEGSGFIVRPNGFILTNNHVIDGAEKIEVKLKDGRHFTAKVAGVDDKTDIAVLKIEADGLTVAPLADSDAVRVGQQCFAIGIPYDQDYSFSAGHVSGKGRNLPVGETRTMYEDYLQTDAFINPGNSGGPLFDIDGKVIGMNTLINGMSRNLAFAIPSNMLGQIGDQLIASGKISRPWLGISIQTLGDNPSLADHFKGIDKGVVVVAIVADTPAYKSDLRPTDVITAVDGAALSNARDLQKEILKKKIGQPVELSVWRNGQTLKIPITTGELPSGPVMASDGNAAPKNHAQTGDAFGLHIQDITKELAGQYKLKATTGVVVTDVAQESPAAESDLEPGDVITEIDEKPVANADLARKLLNNHDAKHGVLLFIERNGQKTYTVIKPSD